MITDGERLKVLLQGAERQILLCSPFIKVKVLRTILSVAPELVPVSIVTRWRAIEIAAGISDLEVLEVANGRLNTELRLLDDLHAKLYLADDRCLVGSANLTASALGWSGESNIDLLTPAQTTDSDVTRLLKRLETAELATYTIRSEMEAKVAALDIPVLNERRDIEGEDDSHRPAWLPRCAAPDKLYEIYRNPETTVVVEGTRQDGLADLRDLMIQRGLSLMKFSAVVQDTLLLMPAFARIIDQVPQGVIDDGGIALVEEARPDLVGQDAREQWRIVRDWIGVFFRDQFEVAPASFITRLRPR